MLLESKFFQPRPRHELVVRPRLLEMLHQGLQRKLILVLAQAGFGKTTLVSHWLATLTETNGEQHRVAWLSLDENDNDPLRFFDYLVTALQRADPSVGHHARQLLSAPQPPDELEPLVISLINDLTTIAVPLICALDDYHTITSQAVHQAIHYFISHAPEKFHLMIISRTEPPLPLTRWRMYRELVEIREHDLRFTLGEAMTYLLETMHCAISPAEVAALEERTEGWIVGLHLAALSLQSHPDTTAFITEFTGSHAYIVDYLTEEVLQRQPADIQEFLFQTALLTRFSGPLCDAVTGRTGSQKILEYLERSHLFVIPLDNERGWYRYHHLFAEMLRRRAQEQDQLHGRNQRNEVYRRATQWYVEQGQVMEAIEYALASEDGDYAAELIESSLGPLVARGQFVTLLQWLKRLPPAVLRARPRLCVARARIAMYQHELDEAQTWLSHTQNALAASPMPDQEMVGEAHSISVDLALNRGHIHETIQLATSALAQLPETQIRSRGEILFYLGIAYFWDDQYAEAVEATIQAAHLLAQAGNILTGLYAWVNLARYSNTQGKLREAMAALDQGWAFAQRHNAHELPLMGTFHNNRGETYYEWNQLDAAEENFLRAIDLSTQARNPRTALRGYSLLIPVYRAKGQEQAAEETLQHALRHMQQNQLPPIIIDECSRTIIRKWLDDGNMAAVEDWIKRRGLIVDAPDAAAIRGLEPEYFLVARYLARQNNLTAASELLASLAASAQSVGKMALYIAIQGYHALILEQLGDERSAQKLLADVLEIAEPEGFIRTFVDEGRAMQKLIAAVQSRLTPKAQAYAAQLLQVFGGSPSAQQFTSPQTASQPSHLITDNGEVLVERLSERELEVLRLVDEGLSDSQIAAKLVLAVGTVKRHLNNIYGKLGVHTRTQALARARALRLLQG